MSGAAAGAPFLPDLLPCTEQIILYSLDLPERPHEGAPFMYASADDRQLIARVAATDEEAMRELFLRHRQKVSAFIRRVMSDDAVIEELTSEVFLEVWRGARNFEGRSAVTTWIFSIAHYRALNVLRKRGEENWDEDDAHQIADERDDPEMLAQKADKSARLRQCSEALTPLQREIIDLVYYHEMSIRDVSEVLDIPEGTVKTRLFKARNRLEKLLEAAGIDRGWP